MQYVNFPTNTEIDCKLKYSVQDLIELLQQCSKEELITISKLLGINIKVDPELDKDSSNPVTNSAITKNLLAKVNKDTLHNVAYTGNYYDLKCAPQKLPNPESLILKQNNKNIIYDGTETVVVDITSNTQDLSDIYNKLDELMKFHPLTVNIQVTPNQFSKLTTLQSYIINWSTNYSNITDTKVYINNILQQNVTDNKLIISNANIKDKVNIRVEVSNGKNTASNTTSIIGYYPIFYGTNNLYFRNSTTLLNSSTGTINVNAGVNDYIYIFSPKELTFLVGGFEGGFTKLYDINILDNNNKSIIYYAYRSDNINLGNTNITWQLK